MKNRWIFRIYNLLVLLALPFILAGILLRWHKRFSKGLERWSERWGRLSPETKRHFASDHSWWWVHAVSLGEVKSIEVFLRRIPQQTGAKVLLSVVTPEALSWAVDKKLADVIIAAPIDLPWVVRRIARLVKPRMFVSVESEFWPNLLREARRAGAKVTLVNGRISARSYKRYTTIKGLLSAVWECFDFLCVRQSEDAFRFIDLGVSQKQIQVTGNLKYDLPLPQRSGTPRADSSSRLTIVVGSSRQGEEKELFPVLERVRSRYSQLRIIWAPRHVDRIPELEQLFASAGLSVARKSSAPAGNSSLLLWDTMGDLLDAYAQADIAIIGGSFVYKGGQNPLEPAALSVPVVFGPSMENFHGIAEVLIQQGGARQVTLAGLESCLRELLQSKEAREEMGHRAFEAITSQQGASDRSLAILKGLAGA